MGIIGEGSGASAMAARQVSGTGLRPAGHGPQLLERVPAVIYIADTGEIARWHYVRPQIEAVLGYAPEEWCANPRLWAERLHADGELAPPLNSRRGRCDVPSQGREPGSLLMFDDGVRARAMARLQVEENLRRAIHEHSCGWY